MEYPRNVGELVSVIEDAKHFFHLDTLARAIKFVLNKEELALLIERLSV